MCVHTIMINNVYNIRLCIHADTYTLYDMLNDMPYPICMILQYIFAYMYTWDQMSNDQIWGEPRNNRYPNQHTVVIAGMYCKSMDPDSRGWKARTLTPPEMRNWQTEVIHPGIEDSHPFPGSPHKNHFQDSQYQWFMWLPYRSPLWDQCLVPYSWCESPGEHVFFARKLL